MHAGTLGWIPWMYCMYMDPVSLPQMRLEPIPLRWDSTWKFHICFSCMEKSIYIGFIRLLMICTWNLGPLVRLKEDHSNFFNYGKWYFHFNRLLLIDLFFLYKNDGSTFMDITKDTTNVEEQKYEKCWSIVNEEFPQVSTQSERNEPTVSLTDLNNTLQVIRKN